MSDLYISITDQQGITRSHHIQRRDTLSLPITSRPRLLFYRLSGRNRIWIWSSVYGVSSNTEIIDSPRKLDVLKHPTDHPFTMRLELV